MHHRRRRPNSVVQRLAPSSSLKNSGATKCLVPAPVGASGPGPGAAVPGRQTDSGPRLDGEDLHAGQTGGVSRKMSSYLRRGGIRRRRPRQKFAHATRNISDRAAKRICNGEAGVGGWWWGGGGIHLRGALAPSQVQSKDRENVENVLLFIFFLHVCTVWETFSIVEWQTSELYLTAAFSILFFYTLFLASTIMSGSATPTSHCHAT